jgi:hypothetical protein
MQEVSYNCRQQKRDVFAKKSIVWRLLTDNKDFQSEIDFANPVDFIAILEVNMLLHYSIGKRNECDLMLGDFSDENSVDRDIVYCRTKPRMNIIKKYIDIFNTTELGNIKKHVIDYLYGNQLGHRLNGSNYFHQIIADYVLHDKLLELYKRAEFSLIENFISLDEIERMISLTDVCSFRKKVEYYKYILRIIVHNSGFSKDGYVEIDHYRRNREEFNAIRRLFRSAVSCIDIAKWKNKELNFGVRRVLSEFQKNKYGHIYYSSRKSIIQWRHAARIQLGIGR